MANNQQGGNQKNHGQGQVKDPQHDGRLKENRGGQQSQSTGQDDDVQPGGQGRVKDPAHDGRLKQNQ